MTPEFSRPFAVERLGEAPVEEHIAAEPDECVALAKRFGLPAVHSLEADLRITPLGGAKLMVSGRLSAKVVETCVVSLEPFDDTVEADISRIYMPASKAAAGEIDLASDGDEVETYTAGAIDLGEFVAEELALSLDPYPRRPGVVFEGWTEDEPAPEGERKARPFDALKALQGGEG